MHHYFCQIELIESIQQQEAELRKNPNDVISSIVGKYSGWFWW